MPAILSRQRVLVSTGTKNLQEQIFFKDLPVLRDALGIPFTATYMKGRGNYLCLHRFEAFRRDPASRALRRARTAGGPDRTGRRGTETGDRAEVEDLPEDLGVLERDRRHVRELPGLDVPALPGLLRHPDAPARRRVGPRHRQPPPALRRCLGPAERVRRGHSRVRVCGHRRGAPARGRRHAVLRHRGQQLPPRGSRAGRRPAARRPRGPRRSDGSRAAGDRRACGTAALRVLHGARAAARRAAAAAAPPAAEERLRVTPESAGGRVPSRPAAARRARRAGGAVALLQGRAGRGAGGRATRGRDPRPPSVSAASRRPGLRLLPRSSAGRGVFLQASPIDVSTIVRELLLERDAGDRADVGDAHGRRLVRLRPRPPGHPRRPRQLCLPVGVRLRHAGDPVPARRHARSPVAGVRRGRGREVVEILQRTDGRAFVLFTSYAVLRPSSRCWRPPSTTRCSCRATRPARCCSRSSGHCRTRCCWRRRASGRAWTSSGEALSCVIVDKLPFASPGDPITAARIGAIAARGGDPFDEYQLPLAILTLQQGLGRLIRHRQDRGVLAVLDPRLRTRAYGAAVPGGAAAGAGDHATSTTSTGSSAAAAGRPGFRAG